jgi:hypothetical protein
MVGGMTSGDESEEMAIDDLDSSVGIDIATLQERWVAAGALLIRTDERFFRTEVERAEETALYLCGATDDSESEPV